MLKKVLLASVVVLTLVGCLADRQVARSFYIWQDEFRMDEESVQLLNSLRSQRIYLHCFDVRWDATKAEPFLTNQVLIHNNELPTSFEFVPVVYLSLNSMSKIKPGQIKPLADSVISQVNKLMSSSGITWTEIQFDCEWNESSRDQYFSFLNFIKSSINPIHQHLSCTVRLEQIKYPDVTGIPPVDRGMLLYYNMGKINEPGTRNSIYDPDVAARYVSYVRDYRLPLDIALPVFSWGVHQRNSEVIFVINNMTIAETRESGLFEEKAKGYFAPKLPCEFKGQNFLETDRLRVEEISPKRSLRAAKQLKPFLKDVNFHVALFQLDSATTGRYGETDFEELYSVFD